MNTDVIIFTCSACGGGNGTTKDVHYVTVEEVKDKKDIFFNLHKHTILAFYFDNSIYKLLISMCMNRKK